MAVKHLSNLDMASNELQNAVVHPIASAPSSPVKGQIYVNTGDDNFYFWDGAQWVDLTAGAGAGSGDVSGPSSSIDSEIAVFSGTTGKIVKRATGTGIVKTASGVLSTATEGPGNDYLDGSTTLDELAAAVADVAVGGQKITGLGAGSATTDAVNKAQLDAAVQGVSWKASVDVATTSDGTLASSFENGDTVDGVVLTTGDRLLVKNQSSASENGVYIIAASGVPTRSEDMDAGTEFHGSTVLVEAGIVNADTAWTCANDADITVDSTAVTFAEFFTANVPTASATTAGKVELATQTETESASDSTRAVTPAGLVSFVQKFADDVGDGTATSITVTHSLGTTDVIVSVYDLSTKDVVIADVDVTSTSAVTLGFATAPAVDAYRVIVVG